MGLLSIAVANVELGPAGSQFQPVALQRASRELQRRGGMASRHGVARGRRCEEGERGLIIGWDWIGLREAGQAGDAERGFGGKASHARVSGSFGLAKQFSKVWELSRAYSRGHRM